MATLEELERWWSLDDVDRALAVLNMKTDIAADMQKKSEREKNNGYRQRTSN